MWLPVCICELRGPLERYVAMAVELFCESFPVASQYHRAHVGTALVARFQHKAHNSMGLQYSELQCVTPTQPRGAASTIAVR